MTTIVWWLAQNTLTIAVLTMIAAVLCRLLRTRPAAQHAIWLVVLLKFVTPPVIAWPWTPGDLADRLNLRAAADSLASRGQAGPIEPVPAGQPLAGSPDSAVGVKPDATLLDANDSEIAQRLLDYVEAAQAVSPPGEAGPPKFGDSETDIASGRIARPLDILDHSTPDDPFVWSVELVTGSWRIWWPAIALAIWLGGTAFMLVRQLRSVDRQLRVIRGTSPAPAHLMREVRRVAKAIGIQPIPALVARRISSPFIWCAGSARMIWPELLADEAAVVRCRGVIAHELAHVWRRDHWIEWLEAAVTIVWWWNPLCWLVRRRLSEAAEMACDAVAMSVLPNDRRAYAEVFLELSSMGMTRAPAPGLGMSTGARQTFERRFAMMLSDNVRSKMSWTGILAAGLLATITLPSWSLGRAPAPDGQGSASASSAEAFGPASQQAASYIQEGTTDSQQLPSLPPAGNSPSGSGTPPIDSQPVIPAPSVPSESQLVQLLGTGTSAGLQSDGRSMERRVQQLEAKLDAILGELHNIHNANDSQRAAAGSSGISELRGSLNSRQKSATSPDHKVIVNVTPEGNLSFTDVASGKQLRMVSAGLAPDRSMIAFSPDGKYLMAQSDGKTLEIEVATGKLLRQGVQGGGFGGAPADSGDSWRGQVASAGRNDFRVIPLKHCYANDVVTIVRELELDNLVNTRVSLNSRTNSLIVAGPIDEIKALETIVLQLDVPSDTKQPGLGGGDESALGLPGSMTPPQQRGKPAAPTTPASTTLDVVNLGTAIITARGESRLARGKFDRIRKLVDKKAVSQEELDEATIHYETAQQKVNLLISIAQSAIDVAKAELATSTAAAAHSRRLVEKGFAPQSQAEQAEIEITSSRAKLSLLESILAGAADHEIKPTPMPMRRDE